MEPLSLADLTRIVEGTLFGASPAAEAASVSIDSRRMGTRGVFFALPGVHTDGHRFLADAWRNGAVAAVVARDFLAREPAQPGRPLLAVDSPLRALQLLAGWWRGRLEGRVVAVTGSNGKTIVKDALVHLLSARHATAGSPGSYNSQLGVPLALLRIPRRVELAVLEAGVSAPGEMAALEAILRPDFGILTNVGLAHIAAFGARAAIAREKLELFARIPETGWVLLPAADEVPAPFAGRCRVHRFGRPQDELPFVERSDLGGDGYRLRLRFPSGQVVEAETGAPSLEIVADLEAAACAAWLLGIGAEEIRAALAGYRPPPTRMEIRRSPTRGITVIDDSCSSDPVSVHAALRCLANMAGKGGRRVFVFGGMRELGEIGEREHASVGQLAARYQVDRLVLVGADADTRATERAFVAAAGGSVARFPSAEALASHLGEELEAGDVVLLKAPRDLDVSRAALAVLLAASPNRLLVDLAAIAENIAMFRRRVGPGCRILAMVKALAYGSDVTRLGLELQRLGVDFLGVAQAAEGEWLRRAGVDLPVLVTLPSPEAAALLVRQRLTPVLHAPSLVEPLAAAARAQGRPLEVHLEVDTGLGRTGVFPEEAVALARLAAATGWLRVSGLMTHFASAESPAADADSACQIERFEAVRTALGAAGFAPLLAHAAATAAAARFPQSHYDMVRIGLGLYGVYPSDAVAASIDLTLAVSLLSRLSGVRTFPRGARLGYGGSFTVPGDGLRAAVLPLGYHDGVPWSASNQGHVLVHGQRAPIVGRVSMDSTIVDVSAIPEARAGMDALVFGRHDGFTLRPEEVARAAGTMVYELLSRIGGDRLERVFLGG